MSRTQIIEAIMLLTTLIIAVMMIVGLLHSPYTAIGVVAVGMLGYERIIARMTPDHPVLEKRFTFFAETYQTGDIEAYNAFMDALFCEGMSKEAVYRWLSHEEIALRG